MMRISSIPCLTDNYAYLVECTTTGTAAIVDASEAEPVLERLRTHEHGKVVAIWSTHHHHDHVGGNERVVSTLEPGAAIYGHASDRGRIPGQTHFLEDGDTFTLGDLEVRALHIPGHTTGAVAYVVTSGAETAVFTGDTLFLGGCGRLFEGTPEMMFASLSKLSSLAPDARVYCGHEYTTSNLRFAQHLEPDNADIAKRARWATAERAAGRPTVPGTMADEIRTNPFLRVRAPALRATLGIPAEADDASALGIIRAAKDTFR